MKAKHWPIRILSRIKIKASRWLTRILFRMQPMMILWLTTDLTMNLSSLTVTTLFVSPPDVALTRSLALSLVTILLWRMYPLTLSPSGI